MNLLQQFRDHWKIQFPHLVPGNCHLFIAVSGGTDSVVLTDLVSHTGFSFTILHCNFQLRGDESNRDESFVQRLGEKYACEVLIKRFDTLSFSEENKLGIQEAARKLRYQWFSEVLDTHQNGKLLTAHHAGDNVETVLFNIFRGTGISGLHGILPEQGNIIRPLLFAERESILAYAKENGLQWVEDSSNASSKYTRNYIRHEIIPVLKQVFPEVTANIGDSIERWRESGELYEQAILLHKKNLCETKGNEVHIPVLKLKKTTPLKTVTFEIIKDFGFTSRQAEDVLSLLESESGRYVASSTHRVIRNRNWLIIAPVQNKESTHVLIEAGDREILFEGGCLLLEEIGNAGDLSTQDHVVMLDAKKIVFPLLLRKWKQGDYFYPLGMQKKKKLSRFFIDRKLSIADKEKIWVIESDKRIAWVIGQRVDDRFKVTPSAQRVFRITCQISPR